MAFIDKNGYTHYMLKVDTDFTADDATAVDAVLVRHFTKQNLARVKTKRVDFTDYVNAGNANENIFKCVELPFFKQPVLDRSLWKTHSGRQRMMYGFKKGRGCPPKDEPPAAGDPSVLFYNNTATNDLFSNNTIWQFILINMVKLNAGGEGEPYLPPTFDYGVPLTGTWTWNGTTTVTVNGVTLWDTKTEFYKWGKIKKTSDTQLDSWFIVLDVSGSGTGPYTLTLKNREGRTIPTGVGETQLLPQGRGIKIVSDLMAPAGIGSPLYWAMGSTGENAYRYIGDSGPVDWPEEYRRTTFPLQKLWNKTQFYVPEGQTFEDVSPLGNAPDGTSSADVGGILIDPVEANNYLTGQPDVVTYYATFSQWGGCNPDPVDVHGVGGDADGITWNVEGEAPIVWTNGNGSFITIHSTRPGQFNQLHGWGAWAPPPDADYTDHFPCDMIRMDQDNSRYGTPGYNWFTIKNMAYETNSGSVELTFSGTPKEASVTGFATYGLHQFLPGELVKKVDGVEVISYGPATQVAGDQSVLWEPLQNETTKNWDKIRILKGYDATEGVTYELRNFSYYTGYMDLCVQDGQAVPKWTTGKTFSKHMSGGGNQTYLLPHALKIYCNKPWGLFGTDMFDSNLEIQERYEDKDIDIMHFFGNMYDKSYSDFSFYYKVFANNLTDAEKNGIFMSIFRHGDWWDYDHYKPVEVFPICSFVPTFCSPYDYDAHADLSSNVPNPDKPVQARARNLCRFFVDQEGADDWGQLYSGNHFGSEVDICLPAGGGYDSRYNTGGSQGFPVTGMYATNDAYGLPYPWLSCYDYWTSTGFSDAFLMAAVGYGKEVYRYKHNGAKPKIGKIKQWVTSTAWKNIGPCTDDVIFHQAYVGKRNQPYYPRNRFQTELEPDATIPYLWPTGTGRNMLVPRMLSDWEQSQWDGGYLATYNDVYVHDIEFDWSKPGKTKTMGHGVLNVKAAIAKALL